jgi:GNAT superfamily N-acetyltransferase
MSEAPVRARVATKRDLDALGELYLEAARAFAEKDAAYAIAMDAGRMWREHIEAGLKEERIRVVVTQGEGREILSFLVARVAPSPPGAARPLAGLIEGAYVAPEYRRHGRLKVMVDEAMRWFAFKRVPWVDLLADLRDEEARAAWKAAGFADVQAVMRRPVPAAD